MQPTEHETMAAMYAAAAYVYEERRGQQTALDPGCDMEPWENLPQNAKNVLLDSVTHVVWAALQGLPDRLHPWRQLIDEVDTKDIIQLQQFHTQIRETLHAAPR